MRITVAALDKKGAAAPTAILNALKSLKLDNSEFFGLASPDTFDLEKTSSQFQQNCADSSVAVGAIFSEPPAQGSSEFANLGDASFAFNGRIYSPRQPMPLAQRLTEKTPKEREKTVISLIHRSEGDYSLILAEQERILAARDPIGVQPLYCGENDNYIAFGSNRHVLWKLGIEKAHSFPPGYVGVASREGCRFKPVKTLAYAEPTAITMTDAACALEKLLARAVRVRIRDVKEVAVAFSGGLDSSLVALLAKKCGANVHLVHVSLKGQAETDEAKKAAEELKLPLSIHLFNEEDVANVAGEVVELIEEPDPIKLAIGIPLYWAAQKVAEAGFKVMLAGQGADELFGGYQRYVNEYCLHGAEKTRRTMFADVAGIYESNLERDAKICGFHDVDLRLPFASYPLVEFALGLPLELKVEAEADSLRKLVLRRAAEKAGLPLFMVRKPKKAVQYSTGINSVLKKLAKKKALSVKAYVDCLFREFGKT
jgi:asparagine synthase (glutamine-hydrolysing)